VVKQSRVSNQLSQINQNPSEIKKNPSQINNSPRVSSLQNQFDKSQEIAQYRSSFADRIQQKTDKISLMSESMIGKNSQNNDINNVSMVESEDSGINVVQKE
jgi:hypothetical protein